MKCCRPEGKCPYCWCPRCYDHSVDPCDKTPHWRNRLYCKKCFNFIKDICLNDYITAVYDTGFLKKTIIKLTDNTFRVLGDPEGEIRYAQKWRERFNKKVESNEE